VGRHQEPGQLTAGQRNPHRSGRTAHGFGASLVVGVDLGPSLGWQIGMPEGQRLVRVNRGFPRQELRHGPDERPGVLAGLRDKPPLPAEFIERGQEGRVQHGAGPVGASERPARSATAAPLESAACALAARAAAVHHLCHLAPSLLLPAASRPPGSKPPRRRSAHPSRPGAPPGAPGRPTGRAGAGARLRSQSSLTAALSVATIACLMASGRAARRRARSATSGGRLRGVEMGASGAESAESAPHSAPPFSGCFCKSLSDKVVTFDGSTPLERTTRVLSAGRAVCGWRLPLARRIVS